MQPHYFFPLIHRVDQLILTKSTGTPKQLAKRLNISERTWYYLLDQLRNDYAFPIIYDRFGGNYYYADEVSHWDNFLHKLSTR